MGRHCVSPACPAAQTRGRIISVRGDSPSQICLELPVAMPLPLCRVQPFAAPNSMGETPDQRGTVDRSELCSPTPAARSSKCTWLWMPSGQDSSRLSSPLRLPGIISRWPPRIIGFLAGTSCILKALPGTFRSFQWWCLSYLAHHSAQKAFFIIAVQNPTYKRPLLIIDGWPASLFWVVCCWCEGALGMCLPECELSLPPDLLRLSGW